jgi:hypothetical protein
MVTCQTDPYRAKLTPASELCFVVPRLPAQSSVTWFVVIAAAPQERREAPAPVQFERTDRGFVVRNGRLELRKDRLTGDLLDAISVDGVQLGHYNPLIWQDPGQNQWVQTDRFESVEASVGPVRTVLTLAASGGRGQAITRVDEQGRQAELQRAPVPFRVTHRITIYPDRPDFDARFVSLANVGDRPLRLRGYFFYLLSAIGGDPADDEEASPGVPNYYLGGQGAWRDPKVGWVFGAEAWPNGALEVSFWRDPGGGEHPDARKQFQEPVVVEPKGAYEESDPPVLRVYGASATTAPWKAVRERLALEQSLLVRPAPAERR